MATAQPFSWVVRFTVAPLWVQDGFSISNDSALEMLTQAVSGASDDELQAKVLEAPSASQLVRMQGYEQGNRTGERVMAELQESVGEVGKVKAALRHARRLLDSVAYVKQEGDCAGVIAELDHALQLLDTRQGEAVAIEA